LGNDPEKVNERGFFHDFIIWKISIWYLIWLLYVKGFETDGTAYSGNRLAWTLLQVSKCCYIVFCNILNIWFVFRTSLSLIQHFLRYFKTLIN
jgi:hypothetical protein